MLREEKKLSVHFSVYEFEMSGRASASGLKNEMSKKQEAAARLLCESVLEPVRAHFGKPVVISSGYRSARLNKLVGGSFNSFHCRGAAADIHIDGVSRKTLFNWIADNCIFSELVLEPAWVHVAYIRGDESKELIINSKTF